MALDFDSLVDSIVEGVGGADNVQAVTHCMTRLRFILKDQGKADIEAIKQIKGVLGCVVAAGQTQVVLGANLIEAYNLVVSKYNFKEEAAVDDAADATADDDAPLWKRLGNSLIAYISASVAPMLPALIAGGMMKVFLLLATLIWPEFAENSNYTLLSICANAPFYFMPILVAYGAAKKLGATESYAMVVAAAMIAPDFIAMVNADPQVPVSLIGINVVLKSYASSLLPALLLAWVAAKLEKLWNKVIPGILRSVFVGMLTVTCTYIATMLVLAPLGSFVGTYIVEFLMWLNATTGPFALVVLTAAAPFLIMVGVHTVFAAFMAELLTGVGYDPLFRPALILHNCAEGGACLGVALRTKDPEFRSECLSIAVGCILAGVSEPAIYGITLRLKKPMAGVCAGGAAGGLVAGILGAKAYMMGYSNVIALPIFQDTILAMVAGIVVAILVSAGVAFALGFEEADVA